MGKDIQSGEHAESVGTSAKEQRRGRGRRDDGRRTTSPPESALGKHSSKVGSRDVQTKPSETGRDTQTKRRGEADRNPDGARPINPTSNAPNPEHGI